MLGDPHTGWFAKATTITGYTIYVGTVGDDALHGDFTKITNLMAGAVDAFTLTGGSSRTPGLFQFLTGAQVNYNSTDYQVGQWAGIGLDRHRCGLDDGERGCVRADVAGRIWHVAFASAGYHY